MGGLCKYFPKPERQKGAISLCVKNTAVKHVKILKEFAIAKKFPALNPLLPLWDLNFSRRDGSAFSGSPFDCS